LTIYSGCQKNVAVFKRFFLQPYTRLYRNSAILNIIMESGISKPPIMYTDCFRWTVSFQHNHLM